MYLPWNIIAGNLISLFAGIFVIFSLWVNDDKKAYIVKNQTFNKDEFHNNYYVWNS